MQVATPQPSPATHRAGAQRFTSLSQHPPHRRSMMTLFIAVMGIVLVLTANPSSAVASDSGECGLHTAWWGYDGCLTTYEQERLCEADRPSDCELHDIICTWNSPDDPEFRMIMCQYVDLQPD